MAFVQIGTGDPITVEKFNAQIFKEYLGQLWWKNLMGTNSTMPIMVKDDLTKQRGDAITLNLVGLMEGGEVTGSNKGIGNEGSVDFFSQRVTIDNVRQLVKIEDVPMSAKRVEFSLEQATKDALIRKSSLNLDQSITSALSDTSSGRVKGRYLYGAANSNWNATHATALTAIDNTADQLTTNMMRIAKRKALTPVNATAKISPMLLKNGLKFEEWYAFVAHPYAIRDMFDNDTAWVNAQLNMTPRSDTSSPIFSGSSFKGAYDGILIYEYERINLVSSSIQVAHNMLLGSQAAGVVWGQRSKLGQELLDVGHDVVFETHEIRGIEKLVFNRPTPEDQGIIHVFSAAVGD